MNEGRATIANCRHAGGIARPGPSRNGNSGRPSGANPFGDSKFVHRNWDILDALNAVEAEVGRPAAQVALAWVMARPGISSTLVGARAVTQLESSIAAASMEISEDQMMRLNDASADAGIQRISCATDDSRVASRAHSMIIHQTANMTSVEFACGKVID